MPNPSISGHKRMLRQQIIQEQNKKYPDFWYMVHKLFPQLTENKKEKLADLIRSRIEKL